MKLNASVTLYSLMQDTRHPSPCNAAFRLTLTWWRCCLRH